MPWISYRSINYMLAIQATSCFNGPCPEKSSTISTRFIHSPPFDWSLMLCECIITKISSLICWPAEPPRPIVERVQRIQSRQLAVDFHNSASRFGSFLRHTIEIQHMKLKKIEKNITKGKRCVYICIYRHLNMHCIHIVHIIILIFVFNIVISYCI